MIGSGNVEELEINFAAFVNSARNVTFVLQKEFSENKDFFRWYKEKQEEMDADELCAFFKELRNRIVKEGINQIKCFTKISKFNVPKDLIDRPNASGLVITDRGIYYLVDKGTPKEDLIPAKTKAKMVTRVIIENAPKKHLGKTITDNNIIELCRIYYSYLKNLIEEWVGILNQKA
jgi:hypothetical protein